MYLENLPPVFGLHYIGLMGITINMEMAITGTLRNGSTLSGQILIKMMIIIENILHTMAIMEQSKKNHINM
jgi:hypothetical protein